MVGLSSKRRVPTPADAQVGDLSPVERLTVVDAAIAVLDHVFVHLPLKRAMHGIDPVQRLRLLRERLQSEMERGEAASSARDFHDEMLDIFHSLRDLHTSYLLPAHYAGKTAFLPFLVEDYFEGNPPERRYVVTRVLDSVAAPFRRGVTITHWNGVPIDRAVELNADREAGSNREARHARGLQSLTIRPMAYTTPPDEAWVVIDYLDGDERRQARFEWQVHEAEPVTMTDGAELRPLEQSPETAKILGYAAETEATRLARKALFFPKSVSSEGGFLTASALGASEADGLSTRSADHVSQSASRMPDLFQFRTVRTSLGTFGYVRIYSFMTADAEAFVDDFVRIVNLLPASGLIVDVRGNGGGNIRAGEQLLQVLGEGPIEPERFHFINTPATLQLCERDPSLKPWRESIRLAVQTGDVYSQGFPITSGESANRVGRRYFGSVVLIVDALCYSTTDIFAAGFQDHGIGRILGTSGCTGAGGANVWTYDLLAGLTGFEPLLPKGTSFRTAIRRSTRVRAKAGVPLEDLGVTPDAVHRMTRRDVVEGNVDLIEAAARLLVAKE